MSDFDDRELGDALRRRAGAATDGLGIEAAHSAVIARSGRVRRRRAAVAGGAVMAGLIAAAVLVIGPGSDSVVTTPADQTDVSSATSVDSSVDTTAPSPPESSQAGPGRTDPDRQVIVTTVPPSTSVGPTTTVASATSPTGTASATTAPSTSAPAAPGTTTVAPSTSPTTPPTSPTTTVAPAPDPVTQSYSSAGGSITVRWDGAALTLQNVTPAAGFGYEVEDERPDRIRVRFQDDDGGDFRIEIRVENGQVVRVE